MTERDGDHFPDNQPPDNQLSDPGAAFAAAVVDAARAYKGVRWRHGGRGREGLDCAGLVLLAFRDRGVALFDASYARGHRGDEMARHIASQARAVPIDRTLDGDVLLFTDGLFPCHVGLRTTWQGRPAVLHAKLQRRRVTEEYLDGEAWEGLRAAFRRPECERRG